MTDSAPRQGRAQALSLLAIPITFFLGTPAIAFLSGAAVSLLVAPPLRQAKRLGSYTLQAAIVLLGLRINLETLFTTNADHGFLVAGYVLLTIVIGIAISHSMSLNSADTKLISAGTAICGGTTIATIAPILRATPAETGSALTIVFLLNAVALLAFPSIGHALNLQQEQFGLWCALAIHDTSSVLAAAAYYGDQAAEVATTVKLGRTLWLIPLALAASLYHGRRRSLPVPGFILAFIAAAAVGSVIQLPEAAIATFGSLSNGLLTLALFLIGTQVSRSALRLIRARLLVQALLLWAIVCTGSLGVIVNLY